jgi:outer membrane receptor protein involved in Fe transport
MKKIKNFYLNSSMSFIKTAVYLLIMLFAFSAQSTAGIYGKLSGYIKDRDTGEPIIGANVLIEGTYLGAAADLDGYYFINSIQPGTYRVVVSAVGYQKLIFENVLIRIDLTTNLDVNLSSTVLDIGTEVVVTSQRSLVQKDLTSTSVTIGGEDIKMMPVESIGQIVNLQAGVIGGHFRGGRLNDVAYLIDGVSITDAFNGGLSVEVENTSIRQMEVISGTFNAEYGQALSGVVNIVTESGSDKFEGSVSAYAGTYYTNNSDIFRNLSSPGISSKNVQFSLSGPALPVRNLTFFVTGRFLKNDGYLYGQRIYNVTDDVPFFPIPGNNSIWIPRNTGDSAFVSMNPGQKFSANGKLTYFLPLMKFTYSIFWDDNENRYYDHGFSWTPDGIMNHYRTNIIHGLQIAHYPSKETFQSLKFSHNLHNYEGYLYEDPFDPRYVNPRQGIPVSGYTFRSGGNQGGRYNRHTNTFVGQYTISSQLSKEHKVTSGVELRLHDIYSHYRDLVNLTDGQIDTLGNLVFTPGYPTSGTITDQGSNITYQRYPKELSAYIQDKMEYDIMIINAGVRFDYFDPDASLPSDLKNPTRNPNFPGSLEDPNNPGNYLLNLRGADPKFQVSPRLGVSFPITDQGILRFSYGHFFKIPNFENLYTNPEFIVTPGASLRSITGNPDLDAEKTVMYEIGLQQVLFDNLALNLTVYYRDIRNWLGMEIVNTYEGFKYARFINRDYANVRGFIVTLDKRFANYFSAKIDYTYQIAEGNASDPYAVYNFNQTNPPIEETKTVVPLDWDQRHTLNMTLNVGNPGDWTLGFIFQYGSGWPYTEDIRISKGVRFENGGIRPQTFNLDLRAEKVFNIAGIYLNTYLWVYNLLDIKNEYGVYATTGRANADLNTQFAGEVIGLNTIEQYVNNPGMYSAPREIRFGFGFGF